MLKTLIVIPTYNEAENVEALLAEIRRTGFVADIVFIDDNSPDGTGQILDRMAEADSGMKVIHRSEKQGIGAAHKFGIEYAYEHQYELLVTMDCDFTHSPADIPRLADRATRFDVVTGSRYLRRRSLRGWNPVRRLLTNGGHMLTRYILGLPYDASGAFRAYRLDHIPRHLFRLVEPNGYAFFFYSMMVLHQAGINIGQVAIFLPPRTYGHSKMSFREIMRSLKTIFSLGIARLFRGDLFGQQAVPTEHQMHQAWNAYWDRKSTSSHKGYDCLAWIYRNLIIRPSLNSVVKKHLPSGSTLLHAGCGSGEVDANIRTEMNIVALDISASALKRYQSNYNTSQIVQGSIFSLPFANQTCDAVYNLGVMEHFNPQQIRDILFELRRVVKPQGKIILFWPHECGLTVNILKLLHYLARKLYRDPQFKFHPDEICHMRSKEHAQQILAEANLGLIDYYFGPRDLFTQAAVVAQKLDAPAATGV